MTKVLCLKIVQNYSEKNGKKIQEKSEKETHTNIYIRYKCALTYGEITLADVLQRIYKFMITHRLKSVF